MANAYMIIDVDPAEAVTAEEIAKTTLA